MGWINNLKYDEFVKAINSIDTNKLVSLLKGWGQKYFGNRWKDYMDEIRRFLAKIVHQIGEAIK
jgi:hypothetical protein